MKRIYVVIIIDAILSLMFFTLLVLEGLKESWGLASLESAGLWSIYFIGLVVSVVLLIALLALIVIRRK